MGLVAVVGLVGCMFCLCVRVWLVGWLVGWLVSELVGWIVSWLVCVV